MIKILLSILGIYLLYKIGFWIGALLCLIREMKE
jgi:hypothetical protein